MSDKCDERAFPVNGEDISSGMTLRDYFAAKAMQGILASNDIPSAWTPERTAYECYDMANAMLAERSKWANSSTLTWQKYITLK